LNPDEKETTRAVERLADGSNRSAFVPRRGNRVKLAGGEEMNARGRLNVPGLSPSNFDRGSLSIRRSHFSRCWP
jgi:hypothetical protein